MGYVFNYLELFVSFQSDRSTPLHLACAQGNLEMVKAMLESQPDSLEVVLFAKDAMDMTPLHTATLYDHTDIVEYLVDEVLTTQLFTFC